MYCYFDVIAVIVVFFFVGGIGGLGVVFTFEGMS